MPMVEPLLVELEQEAHATRRLLQCLPADQLDWRPHPAACSLGHLAMHIAEAQRRVAEMIQRDAAEGLPAAEETPASVNAIAVAFEENLATAKSLLSRMSDDDLAKPWSLTRDGEPVFAATKLGMVRMIMLNHVYHHRGQLSMYLRTLGVALPPIYGPFG
jgi:uncharacterized damage-inducible protein DinB